MKWSDIDIKAVVGNAAPMVGSLLAGSAGSAAGRLLASVLGVEEKPEAVEEALRQDPDAALKVKKLEREHERELTSLHLQAETSRLAEINATMRAELAHDGWFKSGWRPGLGWVFTFSLGSLVGVMVYAVARDHSLVTDAQFTGMLVWLFVTMGGALGLNVRERSKDKARMMGEKPRSFMDALPFGRK